MAPASSSTDTALTMSRWLTRDVEINWSFSILWWWSPRISM